MNSISSALFKSFTGKSTKIESTTINWDNITKNLVGKLFQLVILSITFYILWRIGQHLINKYVFQNPRFKKKITGRKRTLSELAMNVFKSTLLFFYLYELLNILGLPVGTLLASAGILSLALGMGAQGFVSDLVTGLVILSEGQYDVGDIVSINKYTGTVIALGMRTTKLRDSNNTIIYIPNRQITIVENITRGGMGFDIDLQIASNSDIKKVTQAINIANHTLKNKFVHEIKKGPEIIGLVEQDGNSLTYRVHFQILSGSKAKVKSAYFALYVKELQKAGIELS